MNTQIALAGVGGQGILFATKLLAETAIRLGHGLLGSETHGMSQRGGSVVSYLKIGDFFSPLLSAGSVDFLLAFEANEAHRNMHFIRPGADGLLGGRLYVNAKDGFPPPEIGEFFKKNGIVAKAVDADQAALKLGAAVASNLIMLGFASSDPDFPFTLEQLLLTAEEASPKRFKKINIAALEQGRQL